MRAVKLSATDLEIKNSMATITEVAHRAGVSIASVSLVVNDPETRRVSSMKRAKILAVAAEMGYTPNRHAKALLNKQTQVVGLVLPMRDPVVINDYIAEALSGVQSACTERGYNLMIYPHRSHTGKITPAELLQSRFSDGLIFMHTRLCTAKDIDATIDALNREGRHFVMLNSHGQTSDFNSVGVDDEDIGKRGAEFLVHRGHREIAFIGGVKRSPSAPMFARGFHQGLKAAGIRHSKDLEIYSEFSTDRVSEAILQWLKRKPRPTAIMCAYDQIVPDVYQILRQKNLKIPTDVAVLSRGDLPLASYLYPPLTTFHVPIVQMGRQAAELLFTQLDRGKSTAACQQILLPCPLIKRESV